MTESFLEIAPGYYTETTGRAAKNRWKSGLNTRFWKGMPQTVGGSHALNTGDLMSGVCRKLFAWQALDGTDYVAAGTNERFYIWNGSEMTNVTPIRDSGTLGADPFTTVSGSPTVTVSDTGHGLAVGDWVNFSGATAVGGITPSGDYQVVGVPSTSLYTITHSSNASSSATGGGGAVAYQYEISIGLRDSQFGTGWGAGPWRAGVTGSLTNPFSTTNLSAVVDVADTAHGLSVGSYINFSGASAVGGITVSGWYTVLSVTDADNYKITHGSAATSTAGPGGGTVTTIYTTGYANNRGWNEPEPGAVASIIPARVCLIDKWGEDLMAGYVGGTIYHFDTSAGITTSNRMAVIANAPDTVQFFLVSPESRILIAFGAHDGSNDDPLLVRWSDSEDYTVWTPTNTNFAGDFRLDKGNEIICAGIFNKQILILTDIAAYSMYPLEFPYVFGFSPPLREKCGAVSAGCLASADKLYWMGFSQFFSYDGTVVEVPCDVYKEAFTDLNKVQIAKVTCGVNSAFHEIWWFLPVNGSLEINRCVVFDYSQGIWWYGDISRTAFVDSSEFGDNPLAADDDGTLYEQETGTSNDGTAFTKRIESYDVEASEGEDVIFLSRIFPEFQSITGSVNLTVTVKDRNASTGRSKGSFVLTADTLKKSIRIRGRRISIKLESTGVDDSFRMAPIGYDAHTHGKR